MPLKAGRIILCSLFGLAAIQPESARLETAKPAAQDTSPAIMPWSSQFDLHSDATGTTFRIYVSRPSGAPPKSGWPVIYVLDGDIVFATVASDNFLKAKVEGTGALIVGVGYPDPDQALTLRNRDLTPSRPTATCRRIGNLGNARAENYGGGGGFQRFMATELKAAVAARFPVDQSHQTLMGYSFGGLFTLGMLFDDPGAYQTYVIGSPSIWWNEREVLAKETAFADLVRSGRASPRILITSDEREQDPAAVKLPPEPHLRATITAAIREERMVDNAQELARRLGALPGNPGYRVDYAVLGGENHLSGFPVAANRGYAYATTP